ncbi:hypothetical protein K461DRAFT_228107 [Myriangium duriaei CBS 260.36]|uniref:EXPERA domain-containing protein n=1 Tax=Myriangium duriaei CBS 260.36 TaxID=1168546 RepID=A0A9P4IWN5_9PEZI|nr:hypothetical protein K461DRAFT_228107 [Myriangium duriaei CBS 260.36]
MVSTRSHPTAFPSPTASPTKRSLTPSSDNGTLLAPTTPSTRGRRAAAQKGWSHTPSNLTLIWLAISLPLVIWDTGYVLLRPYSMPGGALHWPLWVPYELYGRIDHVYGFKAWNAGLGFTGAQGTLNAVETIGYMAYLWVVYKHGVQERVDGRGAPDPAKVGFLGMARTVRGRQAGAAVLLGFSIAVMTWSKTVLYWLNEAFSGFEGLGHNDFVTLFFLWLIPNGAWIVFPVYMTYVFGSEILEGLSIAAGETKKSQ